MTAYIAHIQHVQDAVSKGAKILTGGTRGKRTEFQPTVLADMTDDCVSRPDAIADLSS